MTTPDELEQAVERVDGFVQRWEARMGTGAQTGATIYCVTVNGFAGEVELRASDLRALLTERAELLATVERMRGQVFSVGDLLSYDMDGFLIRCTYRGDCEGWPLVSFDADGPDAVAIHVRPSRVKPRAALTTGEEK